MTMRFKSNREDDGGRWVKDHSGHCSDYCGCDDGPSPCSICEKMFYSEYITTNEDGKRVCLDCFEEK